MKIHSRRTRLRQLGLAGLIAILAACAAPVAKKAERTGVSIHALNYSAREVATIGVEAPDKPGGGGGGDALNPYSAGGTICCFSVPSTWNPEFKVVVRYQLYPEKEYRKALVGVPPYPDGKAGNIWLIVHEDESAEAVVSVYGPSRPEWPGKIKGYPVPSREYRLTIWEREVKRTQADLEDSKKSLAEFSSETAKEYWEFQTERREKELQRFSGYSDPAYTEYLKDRDKKSIDFYSKRLDFLLRNKP